LQVPEAKAPQEDAEKREMKAQYYGMISDVDEQLGRVWDTLEERGMWDNTVIIVTADHGEQLGDHGLKEKLGFFPQSYHIVGIVRDPSHPETHGTTITKFTENIDIFPTIAEALGQPVPIQCDGFPLTPLLEGNEPKSWRTAATWEYDWRFVLIRHSTRDWPWDRRLEQFNLTTRFYGDKAYVQFGDGSWLAFDTDADETWRTPLTDTDAILKMTQDMLVWRTSNLSRELSGFLVEDGGIGEWPVGVAWRN
jgi:arylsulfatase A-like enzyme